MAARKVWGRGKSFIIESLIIEDMMIEGLGVQQLRDRSLVVLVIHTWWTEWGEDRCENRGKSENLLVCKYCSRLSD